MISKSEFVNGLEGEIDEEASKMPDASGFRQTALARRYFEYLKDSDIGLNDFEPCPYYYVPEVQDGVGETNIHGYSLDADGSRLDLFVVIQVPVACQHVAPQQVRSAKDQAYRFYRRAVAGFHNDGGLDDALAPHVAMERIEAEAESITSIRIYIFTNGECPRAKFEPELREGVSIDTYLWDIDRLYSQITSGKEREEILIDFENHHGCAVPALECDAPKAGYRCYVGFLSGKVLAEMYARHSSRLIEQNVRMFLQAKGKVNGGIQKTIQEEPGRFLAYNNGLSLTAKAVEVSKEGKEGQCLIRRITELQIVNGAQTSGSIFHARQRGQLDLSKIRVQFKLTVPDEGQDVATLVSNISRYANSQNAVKVTDLSANHPFHQQLEKLSRAVFTPNRSDGSLLTHWFYERARGAYLIEKGGRSGADRTSWEKKNPSAQKFTKVDLAKSEVTYWLQPDIVSRGGEKNFVHFMQEVDERYKAVDEAVFKHIIARLILTRVAEDVISDLDQGGFRANVLVYTLAYIYRRYEDRIDFDSIWKGQFTGVSDGMRAAMATVAKHAYRHITDPKVGTNPSEWAKKEQCWSEFSRMDIPVKLDSSDGVMAGAGRGYSRDKAEAPRASETLAPAMAKPADWLAMAQWAQSHDDFDKKSRKYMKDVATMLRQNSAFSRRQIKWAADLWKQADKLGFRPQA